MPSPVSLLVADAVDLASAFVSLEPHAVAVSASAEARATAASAGVFRDGRPSHAGR
ncbi:hypothetical protein [Streptomyces sp. N50]|uniref:hypothetical protein n=1 Tax=Streptomyces sp. N50 TaxID=3081765 RepID=UPI00296255A1|nr:hypothetical protein [Streptomyces sp. N50]WOX13062.1 hypothetical protein R2B38_31485 [Streptomyces sp. N50]